MVMKSTKTYIVPSTKSLEMKCSRMVCLSKYERYSSDEQLSKGAFGAFEDDVEDGSWGKTNVWE